MWESGESHTQEDAKLGNQPRQSPPVHFKRSATEISFSNLQRMEKNYSKLGDQGAKQRESFPRVNGKIKVSSLSSLKLDSYPEFEQENAYVGQRDVSDIDTMKEKLIVSSRGSVRGLKNRVRAGIATFIDQNGFTRNYRQIEKGKIILYTTSMTVVRQTAEKCKALRQILQTHMVRYEEKDMFMSNENQKELRERLGQSAIQVPQVFADGVYIGDFNEVQKLNETGELRNTFNNFTKIQVRSSCDKCGGYRYLPCTFCHGSKKSLHRNDFTEEFCALRCMQCDENGLIRCDICIDQQE